MDGKRERLKAVVVAIKGENKVDTIKLPVMKISIKFNSFDLYRVSHVRVFAGHVTKPMISLVFPVPHSTPSHRMCVWCVYIAKLTICFLLCDSPMQSVCAASISNIVCALHRYFQSFFFLFILSFHFVFSNVSRLAVLAVCECVAAVNVFPSDKFDAIRFM